MPSLTEMVRYADEVLRVTEIEDYPNALNGLQIENSGEVTKIGAAVDASGHTIQTAVQREIDLLVVHHGLFWPGLQPVTGPHYRALKLALGYNLALYSAHLPLDLHPKIGNNVLLASALGFETVYCSAGRRGLEIELAPADLVRAANAVVADIAAPPRG